MTAKEQIAETLNRFPEVEWDRWCGDVESWSAVFGWIARDDGRSDFMEIGFDKGEPWRFMTSSAKHSHDFAKRLNLNGDSGDSHHDCKRVEHDFVGVKAVKLKQASYYSYEMKVDEVTGVLVEVRGGVANVWGGGLVGFDEEFVSRNGCWISKEWLDKHPEHDFRKAK